MTNLIIAHPWPALFVLACASATFGALLMGALAANGRIDRCEECEAWQICLAGEKYDCDKCEKDFARIVDEIINEKESRKAG